MSKPSFVALGVVGLLLSFPALATPCGDQIRALEPRVDEVVARSASLSSGGQAVAASREAQAMQTESGQKEPGAPVQKLPEHDAGATAAMTPLAGGDKSIKARAALGRAQALDRDGDAAGCQAAVEEVRREIGSAQ